MSPVLSDTKTEEPLRINTDRLELDDAVRASSHRGPVTINCITADPRALIQLEGGKFSELNLDDVSQFEPEAIKVLARLLSRQNIANPIRLSHSLMIDSTAAFAIDLLALTPFSSSSVRIRNLDMRGRDVACLANVEADWFEIEHCQIDEAAVQAIAHADANVITIISSSDSVDQLLSLAESTVECLEINVEGGISTTLARALARNYHSGLLCPSIGSDPAPLTALSSYEGALQIETANMNEDLIELIGDLGCSIFRTFESPSIELARQLARMAANEIVLEEVCIVTFNAAAELARISERSTSEAPVVLMLDWNCPFEPGAEAELLKVAERHDRGREWQQYWFPRRPW